MTPQQMKEASMIGSPAQWEAWQSLVASTLTLNMNKMVERAMSNKKRHPMDLMDVAKKDDWSRSWVAANATLIANALAEELLGEERMSCANGQLVTVDLSSIVAQNYKRLRKSHKRLSDRLEGVQADLAKATAALFDDKIELKIQDVRTAAVGMRKYIKATLLLPAACAIADEASAVLAGLMTQFGVEEKDLVYKKVNQKAVENAQKRGRALKMDPADLADVQAVQQIINLYLDFFQREDVELNLETDTA